MFEEMGVHVQNAWTNLGSIINIVQGTCTKGMKLRLVQQAKVPKNLLKK